MIDLPYAWLFEFSFKNDIILCKYLKGCKLLALDIIGRSQHDDEKNLSVEKG